MAKSNEKRIKILNDSEIKELYGLPSFNHADREDFFSLDDETQGLVDECRRLETKCYFILLLGYFRVKPIIFNFSFEDAIDDVAYLEKKYFDDRKVKCEHWDRLHAVLEKTARSFRKSVHTILIFPSHQS